MPLLPSFTSSVDLESPVFFKGVWLESFASTCMNFWSQSWSHFFCLHTGWPFTPCLTLVTRVLSLPALGVNYIKDWARSFVCHLHVLFCMSASQIFTVGLPWFTQTAPLCKCSARIITRLYSKSNHLIDLESLSSRKVLASFLGICEPGNMYEPGHSGGGHSAEIITKDWPGARGFPLQDCQHIVRYRPITE